MLVKLPHSEGDANVLPSIGAIGKHVWPLHQQTL